MKIVLFNLWGEENYCLNIVVTNEAKRVMKDHELRKHLEEHDGAFIINRDLRCDPRLVELCEKKLLVVPNKNIRAYVVDVPEDIRDGWHIRAVSFNSATCDAHPESDNYWEVVEEPYRSWPH